MKAILIHNPTAGDGEISPEEVTSLLRRTGLTPLYQSSKIGELSAVLAEPAELVVVAGGDGTVTKVLAQMPDRRVPVAILPTGTANNIASSFGIRGPLDDLAAGLRDAVRRRLDIGLARGPWGRSYFVERIGLGAIVRSAKQVAGSSGSQESRLQAARDCIGEVIETVEPDRVAAALDGESLPDAHLMVEILNIARCGPGLELAPDIDPGDGQLDVIMLEPDQRQEMRRWLAQANPSNPAPVRHWRGRQVRLAWDETPLHIDDDLVRHLAAGAVEVELTAEPATILVPHR